MIKVHNFAAVLAIGAMTALAGCSSGGEQPTAAAAPAPAPAAAPAPAPAMSNPQANEVSHSLVRQVQTELKHNHMYAGRVDGIWGPMTRRGVMRFQQKNNIQPSGELDDATLQAMNVSAPANGMSGGMSGGSDESGANGTNMPSGTDNGNMSNGSMNNGSMNAPGGASMSGPGTGGTAAPAH